ncbi:putative phage tail component, N-terminal domain-containing protein [Streptococcus gallolyticus]|uniref:Putative phage tail component, N-terminal domain-containing protein n=1 Tax=Streptococcus gallolyticus TaxID=315405 RepID=A0A1I7JH61_9STRE|nr:distal tail protein Dit [Streptococcus gallolyticus]SFC83352.1 putative phage tail component, N-terminal domain-containing protein [Streptococcus gallolyticus]SFU84524.1 putative phage tail component, N-terminal domain-containing protein [Streptococcus gallolyticus]
MTKIMTFNGVDMSKYFRVTDIIRPIGNERSIATNDALSLGVTVQEVKRGAKEHTVKFDMKTNNDPREMELLKHELAGVLNVSEPVKITYSDEPDKYYLGMTTGDVTPDNITRWFQRSELKLIIPDGVAHSTTYKKIDSFADATVTSGKMTFNVTNNGTEYAYPIITVKHNYDNGYIGLVNNNAALEIGNREEVDTEEVKQSELLFDYRDSSILSGYTNASKNVGITNEKMNLNSTLNTVSVWGRQHIQLTSRGNLTGNNLNSASLTWEIPADSNGEKGSLNDYIWWRQVFWLGLANQYGYMKVTVSDTDGNFLYGTETFKRSNGLTCEYNFLTTDGKGGYKVQQRWTFTGTHLDTHNPFNSTRGYSDLKRNDDVVQVYWWGSYPKFRVPEIKGKKSAKIHVTFGAVGQKPLVTHMYLDGICYRKDYVPTTLDIPNRFSKGTNVVINSEDDTVYIDGIPKTNDVVNGSDWLAIPPGTSQLELYTSSWVQNMPTVAIEFEERYL